MKNLKRNGIITSVVALLPVLVGLILWNRLPDVLTTHWGADGVADGWSEKGFAVFFLPLLMLALHWLVILLVVKLDRKNLEQNPKLMGFVYWIMPVISLFTNGFVLSSALGVEFKGFKLLLLPLALMFFVMGNYLPKCRRNATMGIKLPWTFRSEENWDKTHRFGGRVWMVCGILMLLVAFLPLSWFVYGLVGVIAIAAIVPTVYSGLLYRKQVKEGTLEGDPLVIDPKLQKGGRYSLIFVALVLVFCTVTMFTGDVEVTCGETSFTVDSVWHQPLEVDYDAVESVEFCEADDVGVRTFGFGSSKLSMGQFRSDTYGDHTRYTYNDNETCVVLTVAGKTLVLNGKDAAATEELYTAIVEKIG